MNRKPGSIWSLRMPGVYPNGYVRTTDNNQILITMTPSRDFPDARSLTVSRRDARLLAKRINECLDGTVKR